jgi:hypothetical protein
MLLARVGGRAHRCTGTETRGTSVRSAPSAGSCCPSERNTQTNKPPRTRVSRDCLSQTLAGTAMAACVPCRLCASMAHPPRSQPMLCCAVCTGHVVCVCAPHRAGRVEIHNTRVLRPHSAARCHALRERRLHRVASAACRTPAAAAAAAAGASGRAHRHVASCSARPGVRICLR